MAYSSARQNTFRRAARKAAREAGLSLEEWVETLFADDGGFDEDIDEGRGARGRKPATDDRTAMRLLAHRLDTIEALLANIAENDGADVDRDSSRVLRDLENAISSRRKDGKELAAGLARVVGEDLPISRNAASGAMREIGKRLDRLSASMTAAQKGTAQPDAHLARLERRLDDISRQLKTRNRQASDTPADAAIAAQTKRLEEKLDAMSRKLSAPRQPVAHARIASTPHSRVVATADPELKRKIGVIDNAVSQILQRQRDLSAEVAAPRGESARVAEIENLRKDIARLQARVDSASGQISTAVEQRLSRLSAQLDTATRGELGEIRKELRELAERVESGTRSNDSSISEMKDTLSRMVAAEPARRACTDREQAGRDRRGRERGGPRTRRFHRDHGAGHGGSSGHADRTCRGCYR